MGLNKVNSLEPLVTQVWSYMSPILMLTSKTKTNHHSSGQLEPEAIWPGIQLVLTEERRWGWRSRMKIEDEDRGWRSRVKTGWWRRWKKIVWATTRGDSSRKLKFVGRSSSWEDGVVTILLAISYVPDSGRKDVGQVGQPNWECPQVPVEILVNLATEERVPCSMQALF